MKDFGLDPTLNYQSYSIFRIPVDLLPTGFMDDEYVKRSRSTMNTGLYENEFGAVFASDSTGFYRRSLIEKATPSYRNPVVLPSGESLDGFSTCLTGARDKNYIMAVDTAFQRDNFAIVILEQHPDHARVVYCWTTNNKTFKDLQAKGLIKQKDFYAYCGRKIRDLMKQFNIIHIAMDSQGGGRTITEFLHNELYLEPGEQLIWELNENSPLWNGKKMDTDDERGLHLIEMCNFVDAKWTSDSNHGMKHDLEQRVLLFPYLDTVDMILADKDDSDSSRMVDTLTDVISEINDLKEELQTIVHSSTQSGREQWAIPRIKDMAGDSNALTDDRYAALLMANSAARRLRLVPVQQAQYAGGGFVGQLTSSAPSSPAKSTQLYVGPGWFTEKMRGIENYGRIVER
jgi:hypothetical protein